MEDFERIAARMKPALDQIAAKNADLDRMYANMLAGGATMVRARDEGVEFVSISPDELFVPSPSPSEQTGE